MKFVRRIAALFLAALTVLSAVPVTTGAAFTGEDKIVIVIDPGHGGYDPGASKEGMVEKKLTLEVAIELKALLEANGNFTVYMTRTTDTYLSIAQRGIIANDRNADLLFSIHFDGGESTSYRGASFITSVLDEYAMVDLGNKVLAELKSEVGLPARGSGIIRRKDNQGYYWNAEKQWDCQDSSLGILSDYYGIPTWGAKFGIPAVIVEHGFLSNSSDRELINTAGAKAIAQADANAIISYYTNHSHTYAASATTDFPSNCCFTGKESVKCTTCGHRKNVAYIEADTDNHYWINETSKAATCGVDGYVSHECRITLNLNEKGVAWENHKETIYQKAEPHDYQLTESKEVTHATDGYSTYKCSKCGDTYTDTVKAEGHSWYLSKETKPTCTEQGSKEYACRGCEEIKTEAVDALGHKEKLTVDSEPTCVDMGVKIGECTVCGEEINETLPPLGHTFEESVSTAPTCVNDGIMRKSCTVCEYTEKNVLDPIGHTKGDNGACTVCGEVLETVPEETETAEPNLLEQIESMEETSENGENEELKLQNSQKILVVVMIVAAVVLVALLVAVRLAAAKKNKRDDFETADENRDPADEPEETTEEIPEEEEAELPAEDGAEIHKDEVEI